MIFLWTRIEYQQKLLISLHKRIRKQKFYSERKYHWLALFIVQQASLIDLMQLMTFQGCVFYVIAEVCLTCHNHCLHTYVPNVLWLHYNVFCYAFILLSVWLLPAFSTVVRRFFFFTFLFLYCFVVSACLCVVVFVLSKWLTGLCSD